MLYPPAFASPDWPDGHDDNPLYVQQRYGSNAYVPVRMINLLQHVWLRGAYQAAESFERVMFRFGIKIKLDDFALKRIPETGRFSKKNREAIKHEPGNR